MKNTIKFFTLPLMVTMLVAVKPSYAARNLHDANNLTLLKHACPQVWEPVEKIIDQKPTSVPWASSTDKNQFINFQENFIISTTKLGTRDYNAISLDVITVLSECAKRHNFLVNAEFGKVVGKVPELQKKIDITPIIQYYLKRKKN